MALRTIELWGSEILRRKADEIRQVSRLAGTLPRREAYRRTRMKGKP